MTTLIVTFVLVVGLAMAVLYSVAAPPLRARGSVLIERVDRWIGRAAELARGFADTHLDKARHSTGNRGERRARAAEERKAVHQH